MKRRTNLFLVLTPGVLALVLITGCGKKSDAPAPAAPVESPAAPTPAANTTSTPAPVQTAAPDARLAESQAAINASDYERAANALVAVQQSRLNAQQAEALAQQMRQLQRNLAGAVAGGDPRAKAAAAKLRASATVR